MSSNLTLPVLGPSAPPDLLGLPREQLGRELAPLIDRPFRVDQIYQALYARGIRDFDGMTDLSKELRARLAESFRIGWPEVEAKAPSADGTVKYLFRLHDGATVEAVDIPDRTRRTLCISSQAGCALACTFCVTGFWGAGRNLTAGEIVSQVLAIRTHGGLPPEGLRLVFMGMGEPLLNVDNLERSLAILSELISLRRITVSTAGIIPGLEAMAAWERRPNLAISLHAPDEARRNEVMPINKKYPLAELLDTLAHFPLEPGRKITFEYILIRGFNDSLADADQLYRLLRKLRAKVNLIPINPDPVLGEHMVPPDDRQVDRFQQRLLEQGMTTTVRRRRGGDVAAACGQLRAFGRDPRGVRARETTAPSK